MPGTGRALPRD
jgi:hypothetical protein